MASTVQILINARNQANTAFGALNAAMRASARVGSTSARDIRNSYQQASQQVGVLTTRLGDARLRQAALRGEVDRTGDEVERLTRLVGFWGQAASDDLRNELVAAQAAAHGARNALADADDEADQLARALARADREARRLALTTRLIDSHMGRLVSRVRDVGDAVVGMVGPHLARFAAWTVLLAGAFVPLVAIAGNLLGLIQLLAPATVAAGMAFAALKLGLHGVGDAIKAGLEGDSKALAEALKGLAPAARRASLAIIKLLKEWRQLRAVVQQRLFANVESDAYRLNAALRPLADRWLPEIAGAFSELFTKLTSGFERAAKDGRLDFILRNVTWGIKQLIAMGEPLARIFLDIAEVAAGPFAILSENANNAAEAAADWVRRMKESGKLGEWLQAGIDTMKQLIELGHQIGRVLGAVFRGAQEDGRGLIEVLTDIAQRTADWLNTDDGQEFIDGLGFIVDAIAGVAAAVQWLWHMWEEGHRIVRVITGQQEGDARNWANVLFGAGVQAFAWIGGAMAGMSALLGHVRTVVGMMQAAINSLTGRTIFIDIVHREQGYLKNIGGGGGGGGGKVTARASGGPTAGWTQINEQGQEVIRLPSGSMVYSAPDTQRMAQGGGNTSATVVEVAASPALTRELGNAIIRYLAIRARRAGSLDRVLAGVR